LKDGSDEYHKNFLPSTDPQVEEMLADAELKNLFRQKLGEFRTELNDKELDILDLRLLAEKPMTLQEIGARHQISRERVRQIEDHFIKRLRQYLKNEITDWEDYRPERGLACPGRCRGTTCAGKIFEPEGIVLHQASCPAFLSGSWGFFCLAIMGVPPWVGWPHRNRGLRR
jgi:hypothetical protein